MFINTPFRRICFITIGLAIISAIKIYIFSPIYYAQSVIFPYAITPFDICIKYPEIWLYIKKIYIICSFISALICLNSIYNSLFKKRKTETPYLKYSKNKNSKNLSLLIGKTENNLPIVIPEPSLYQNILITGTIGTGKTSCAIYPFTKQLLAYQANNLDLKLGMLILDVKGNYYKKVTEYAKKFGREQDLMVIELNGNIRYNPLDKPNLKPAILANRLKTILTLFSQNNGESYWLDKAEQVLTECIKLCRLYNNGYVTFVELHKLITIPNYYSKKIELLRENFLSGKLSKADVHNLLSAIEFFEKEFNSLDSRTSSILKSEITRITGCFISDYDILDIFSPAKEKQNFYGFKDVVENGKIVVLNMNIAEYRNLSKIIAAYLKLDFQTEVMSRLANNNSNNIRSVAFISDEYHEYVTDTDANFFAQSREAKCVNIVATQSYTSLLSALNNQYTVKVIVQNLINKLWFRTDDTFTIEDAQKQIGKEEKVKFSQSFSENSKETNFNYLTNSLNSQNASLSESINSYTQYDYVFDTNFFTQELETFSCLAFLSTGTSIIPPMKLKLTPYFKQD